MNEKFFKRPRQLRTAAPAIELVVCAFSSSWDTVSPTSSLCLSFVAAVQHTSIQSVGDWKFNSAMTTGNLRDATSGLTHWILGENVQENREQFLILGSVCLLFMIGGLIGGLFTLHLPQQSLLPCTIAVAVAACLSYIGGR